jgi:Mg-chelatase subunit ChlD
MISIPMGIPLADDSCDTESTMSGDKSLQRNDALNRRSVSISKGGIEISRTGKPIARAAQPGNIYILLDCSVSMRGPKIAQAKAGALNFARAARSKGYVTGLIQFDSAAKLLCEPGEDISILEGALGDIKIGDLTHMAKAIDKGCSLLRGMSGAKVMVVVTDGLPNGEGDPDTTLRAAESAKKMGIDIIAIGTDDANKEFLGKLASRRDLAVKTESIQLEKTISEAAIMLPSGNRQRRLK